MGSGPSCEHFAQSLASCLRFMGCSRHVPEGPTPCTTFHLEFAARVMRMEESSDIDHGQMFRLNPVGALILESLGKGCPAAEIAQEIARQPGSKGSRQRNARPNLYLDCNLDGAPK